jgi:hypothetical protein
MIQHKPTRIALNPPEIGGDFRGVLIAEISIFLESFINYFFKLRRDSRIDPKRGHGLRCQNGMKDDS